MSRWLTLALSGWLAPALLFAQKNSDAEMDSLRQAYILRYRDIAMDEMERSGVPASIKLAQALLETRAGTSELAQKANNHFGLKCGKNWNGETYAKNDDEFDAKGQPVLSCFRKYAHVVASYADHSAFLQLPEKKDRYGFLFALDPLDYKGWAQGLQKAGYSPVSHYAERLIFYIERHQLYEYDRQVKSGRLALKRVATLNGARLVQAREGETLRRIAQLYQLPADSLMVFNDSLYALDRPLQTGDFVFLESKGTSVGPGAPATHRAQKGQTLRHVAQYYGVRLRTLQQYNPYAPDAPLTANAVIRLQLPAKPGLAAKGISAKRDSAAPKSQPSSGLVVEMLPTEPLAAPIPARPASDARPSEASPVTINMRTGEVEEYHVVVQGDTLSSIARRYQTTVERLRRLNPGLSDAIRPGQTLRVR
ncbi:MAG: LysM peptidoglycan-binding domain-containing protein [Saprospiraceae bacterium]|nr:LysM peptidoglycan-binding domain-containing protein [Saprospiraceae bacterium]MDW8228298.1 LysM peptidoglycan-binding domain-containing protein [Saprospiraceae bacterium]